MSEDKRPLAVDFSQKNDKNREVTYSVKGGPEQENKPLPPSALFSNNPIQKAPGTFSSYNKNAAQPKVRFSDGISNLKAIENNLERKKSDEKRLALINKIISLKERKNALFSTLEVVKNVYSEADIEKASSGFTAEIDGLETQISSALSIEDFENLENKIIPLEKDLLDLKENVDHTIASKIGENERTNELIPIQGRYLALETRATALSKKMSSSASILLLSRFASLKWLVGGLETRMDTPLTDLIMEINEIEDEIIKAEALVTKNDIAVSDAAHETLNLFQKYAEMAQSLGALQNEGETVSSTSSDEFKNKIIECEKSVEEAKKLFNIDPTAENLESLKEKIDQYEANIQAAKTGAKEEPILIPWNLGLPSNKFLIVAKKGNAGEVFNVLKIKITDENNKDLEEVLSQERSDYWLAQKARFEEIFATYTTFFTENTPEKIKQYSYLIRIKNRIIQKFTRGNLLEAVASIEDFEKKLPLAIENWNTKKAEEEANKKLEKEEKKGSEAAAALIEEANRKAIKEESIRKEDIRAAIEKNEILLVTVEVTHNASHSTLTKEMLERLMEKLAKKQTLVSEAPNENLAERLDDLRSYQEEVMGILKELGAPRSPINKRPLRAKATDKDKRNQKIQLRDGRTLTVAEWEKENSSYLSVEDKKRIEGEREAAYSEKIYKDKGDAIKEIKNVYEKIIGDPSDPQAGERLKKFKEVYSKKDWSKDPVGLEAYKEIFFEIVKDQKVRREAEKYELIRKQQENTFDEEEDGSRLLELEQIISELNEDISSVNSLSYGQQMDKYRSTKSVDNETSINFFRHTDRPSDISDQNYLPNKEGWDTLSQTEIDSRTKAYIQPQTLQKARVLTTEEREAHNNLTPEDVATMTKKNPSRFADMSPVPMARQNEPVEEMGAPENLTNSPRQKDETSHTPEYTAKMKESVSRVLEKITQVRMKNWRSLILPIALTAAGGLYGINKALSFDEPPRRPATLGQAMSWNWGDYPRDPEEQFFFEKIKGRRPEDFAKFIREVAPSVTIDIRTNTITSIPTLNVRKILTAESLEGVNNGTERIQLSKVVENLYQLGKHTDPNYKKIELAPEMLPESLTLEQLYVATLSAMASADAKVAKDKKI